MNTVDMKDVTITVKGSQASSGTDDNSFELVTDGEYSLDEDSSIISYTESQITGYEGMKTTFLVSDERVVLTRGGGVRGEMIFCVGQKHHFVYETDYGSVTMGIDTQNISRQLDENGGTLEISYVIDVDNVMLSRNAIAITVRPRV